jgi:23S rRNA (uracil1939-C5)-methyltransferase
MAISVTFEKIVGGGKALGYLDGRPCFAAGPLPGETADVVIIKDKPGFIEVGVVKIIGPAPQRNLPAEDHYLSCSPWQGVQYDYQLELKRTVLADAFARPGLELAIIDMVGASNQLGYRNKLEFSVKPSDGRLDLAFHERGSYEGLVPLPHGCTLGSEAMNKAALELIARAHKLKLGGYMETLTVRQSSDTGQILGHIALHQVPKRDWSDLAVPRLAGVVVSRVRRRVDHELIWNTGETQLTDKLGGVELTYPYNAFFQTNVEMFELVLKAILAAMPRNARIVDLYGGVGTIGLAAAKFSTEVLGVEINESSVKLAQENADKAGLTNYRAIATMAQRLNPELLAGVDCVVVDPPRAGLELQVVKSLLAAAPARIIYLSCNPSTQARDILLLKDKYSPSDVTGFDLYPGTLHLESLVVLDRI